MKDIRRNKNLFQNQRHPKTKEDSPPNQKPKIPFDVLCGGKNESLYFFFNFYLCIVLFNYALKYDLTLKMADYFSLMDLIRVIM